MKELPSFTPAASSSAATATTHKKKEERCGVCEGVLCIF